jgi:hypothetical protein
MRQIAVSEQNGIAAVWPDGHADDILTTEVNIGSEFAERLNSLLAVSM